VLPPPPGGCGALEGRPRGGTPGRDAAVDVEPGGRGPRGGGGSGLGGGGGGGKDAVTVGIFAAARGGHGNDGGAVDLKGSDWISVV